MCADAPGGVALGGNRIHFLEPLMTAFHADVPFGSTWKDDPDLVGPMMSHLTGKVAQLFSKAGIIRVKQPRPR